MNAITITAARYDDLELLNQLMYDLHHEHHLNSPQFFKTAEEVEQEKSIARYLDDPECLVFVARDEDQLVGMITGHFCELTSSVSKPLPMGSIDELYIRPEYRQKGVAKRLCQKLEQTFIDYGVEQIFVEVWHFNESAQSLYHQLGFEPHIHWLRKAAGSR
ncbi:N-acetyltransferase family protein [Vibrio sp.]|uniref:GNAT family N-acetyltransferase n=1 Tax=Vibrio sp. TaxID=678 RepID=UPI003D0C4CE3